MVSIHAPTRGATCPGLITCISGQFQSTHPHGVRHRKARTNNGYRRFNPRTHTGCDTRRQGCCCRPPGFNPRTHTGCDCPRSSRSWASGRFNPRTHTGCDERMELAELVCSMFQSTHPHGVRPVLEFMSILSIDVSIHAPTRGATSKECPHQYSLSLFQSTHPHGVRQSIVWQQLPTVSFNPRTHTGCDYVCSDLGMPDYEFQSTHPHGVRLPLLKGLDCLSKSFNPRTHTGCDRIASIVLPDVLVSIHAPTRGATGSPLRRRTASSSFNPRTHTGCDTPNLYPRIPALCFNPRTHTGCDNGTGYYHTRPGSFNPRTHTGCDCIRCKGGRDGGVSIHAPTRGATLDCVLNHVRDSGFNPRTHTGCDTGLKNTRPTIRSFNPRTHTGCDIFCRCKACSLAFSFNPRTHTGCDSKSAGSLLHLTDVSIHAPTRGATYSAHTGRTLPCLFQSTHPHGVRPLRLGQVSPGEQFQSTHPHGVRRGVVRRICVVCSVSIHAPTRGATCLRRLCSPKVSFQSTHPHGVRRLRTDAG